MRKSWAPEVLVDGKWSGNAMRFATQVEADKWGQDLLMRWFVPTDNRSVESDDPVNYVINENNELRMVKVEA
jgi:hypothetical protein